MNIIDAFIIYSAVDTFCPRVVKHALIVGYVVVFYLL